MPGAAPGAHWCDWDEPRPAGSLWGTDRLVLAVSPHPGTATLLGQGPSLLFARKSFTSLNNSNTCNPQAYIFCTNVKFLWNIETIIAQATSCQILCMLVDSETPSHQFSSSNPFPPISALPWAPQPVLECPSSARVPFLWLWAHHTRGWSAGCSAAGKSIPSQVFDGSCGFLAASWSNAQEMLVESISLWIF